MRNTSRSPINQQKQQAPSQTFFHALRDQSSVWQHWEFVLQQHTQCEPGGEQLAGYQVNKKTVANRYLDFWFQVAHYHFQTAALPSIMVCKINRQTCWNTSHLLAREQAQNCTVGLNSFTPCFPLLPTRRWVKKKCWLVPLFRVAQCCCVKFLEKKGFWGNVDINSLWV